MSAFYNENDPDAAQWLRNLMDEGLIPDGTIDTRSIADLEPGDLDGFAQVHLFAGIGGWSRALDLAGWPRDRPVWTGSCPCQPFSVAGKGLGANDERHLWPAMRDLIAERHPPVVFGEQVASKDGRVWLAGVRADLEALGYRVAAADLCAAGVGAPHIRQRLFWVADASRSGAARKARDGVGETGEAEGEIPRRGSEVGGVTQSFSSRAHGGLADADTRRLEERAERDGGAQRSELEAPRGHDAVRCGDVCGLGDAELLRARAGTEQGAPTEVGGDRPAIAGAPVQRVRHAIGARPQGHAGDGDDRQEPGRLDALAAGSTGAAGAWGDFDLVACADGVARRVESGTFPLAHGLPRTLGPGSARQQRVDLRTAKRNRRIRLKGYGNAIVPQLAAEFIAAFMESRAHPPVARDK